MWKKSRRVSTRVHDRQIDRNVARVALKKQGVHRPNKCLKDKWRLFAEEA